MYAISVNFFVIILAYALYEFSSKLLMELKIATLTCHNKEKTSIERKNYSEFVIAAEEFLLKFVIIISTTMAQNFLLTNISPKPALFTFADNE
jgi:hypothetical protein